MTTAFFHYTIAEMNHYETLGIAKTATPDEIKKAYRKLASKHHPDKGGDTAMFQQVEEAYRVLSDPQQRQQYDNPVQQMGPQGFHFDFGNHPDMQNIFSQFGFGPFAGHHPFQQPQPRRNKDIRADIEISLAETLADQNKTLSVKTSTGERQTIDVTIPRGITPGTTIKYTNLGDNMFSNLPRGDFYLTVHVLRHPNYVVNGLDLMTSLTVDCFQAILGSEQTIVGLDGKQFVIQTPQGCQHGTKLKISGEGLWEVHKDVKGHLFVNVSVLIPNNLTEDQKQLIKSIQSNR